jgi:hypothetical protein
MTTTPIPQPNVPPPPGASFVDDWHPEGYRILYGSRRDIGGEVEVSTSVAQLADKRLTAAAKRVTRRWFTFATRARLA